MAKILFLGANARNTTRLDIGGEVRDVREEIAKAGAREAFPLEAEFAVTPEQLHLLLQRHKPNVLHFSGHGLAQGNAATTPRPEGARDLVLEDDSHANEAASGGLVIETRNGAAVAVRPETFTRLLEIVKRIAPLRCVVLNACFSATQAEDIAKHVDCVIGMRTAISDDSAKAFAIGFYRAIAMGQSIKTAFDLGCNEIELRGRFDEKDIPRLFPRASVEPEELLLLPEKLGKPATVPLRERLRRAAPFVAALLCLVAAAVVFWAPGSRAPQKGAIVVAGPWLGSSAAREGRSRLCEALEKTRQEGEPKIQCLARPLVGTGDDALHKNALEAGAVLLILIDAEGAARVRPLGLLANDEILDLALPLVERASAVAPALAEMALSLAHLVEFREDHERLQIDRFRCTPAENAPRSITLLALLTGIFAPSCEHGGVDSQKLRGACDGGPSDGADCKLAIFLYSTKFASAPDAAKLRETLKNATSYKLWIAAMPDLARRACRSDHLESARQALIGLWLDKSWCSMMSASSIAACLLNVGKVADEGERALLRGIEAFADTPNVSNCDGPLRATALADRATWRAWGGQWDAAALDFAGAYEAMPAAHAHGLNRVEVLLRQGDTKGAALALDQIRTLLVQEKPSDDSAKKARQKNMIHEALLRWSAKRIAGDSSINLDAALLLDLYRAWPDNEPVFVNSKDPVLSPLVCPDSAAPSCAYTILASPKTSASETLLKQALEAARVPPKPGAP